MIVKRIYVLLLLIACAGKAFSQADPVDHWESLVYASDTWHYYIGLTSGPPAGWQEPGFDASSWPQGLGGFGYGDGDDNTAFTVPPNPMSVFIVTSFTVTDTSQIAMAVLNMDFDDGFVAWLNGVEIARANLGVPGDFPAWDAAAADHEALLYQGYALPSYTLTRQKLNSCLVNGTNTLAVQVNNSNNASSDMTCMPFLSVGMKTSGMTYRAVPDWFTPPYTGFGGSHLPLIMINTNGVTIQQEPKLMVDMGVIDNGPGQVNHMDDPWNGYNGKIGLEYRGSSSMMFPKKNYTLETWTPEGLDTACSLLGMPKEADWVLHGPYSDKSLIRNYLSYNLGRSISDYAPRTRFCELFIDGQYWGIYVLTEKIKQDSNRVNIARLKPEDVEGHQLTGGYIVKIDRSAGDYTDGWFSPYPGTGTSGESPFFAYHDPNRFEIVQVQKNYVQNKVTTFEGALHGDQYKDPYTGYRKYIDVGSFIDFFLLVEVSKNTDGYRLSAFLYKDRDDRDPLIHMGPIWDYNLAFGNANYLEAGNTYGWNYTVQADGWGTPFWWQRFMTDPYFANRLNCRWHELRQGVLSDDSLMARIEQYVEELGPAIDCNFNQWPVLGQWIWPNQFVGNTYQEEINFMKNWILQRTAWIDANIPGADCPTPVEEHEGNILLVRAYPNPAIGQVNIEIQNPLEENLVLEIFSVTGQVVYTRDIGREAFYTDLIGLRPGSYLMRVTGGQETRTTKILIR
jgi:hypothetical protein